jgi:regulatory protein
VADAYTVALTLLSARELSETQLRARLARRQIDPDDIDDAIARLKADRTLDDRRVAMALARMESGIKHRGRARVIQKIRQAGIAGSTAEDAVREVFQDVDEDALLQRALDRRLRGKTARELDERGRARIVRGLMAQGFPLERILKKLQ